MGAQLPAHRSKVSIVADKDVFKAVESGLLYSMLPRSTAVSQRLRRQKKEKKRVAILPCFQHGEFLIYGYRDSLETIDI